MSAQEVQKVTRKSLKEIMDDTDENILYSLRHSVYPGAKDESIGMVLAYCRAKNYDPIMKAVHIVPMSVRNAVTGNYEMRDVIMPGITAYRIDAERSGSYMGLSRPVFGPNVIDNLGGVQVTYPEWCRITVKKMVQNIVCEFEAEEYWEENYANKGRDKVTKQVNPAPNDMWAKRRRGQLAKCTEAQALRKAFPGIVSSVPTFEEMEGKDHRVEQAVSLVELAEPIPTEHVEVIREKMKLANVEEIEICRLLKIDCIESLTTDKLAGLVRKLDLTIKKNQKLDLPINKPVEIEVSAQSKEFLEEME